MKQKQIELKGEMDKSMMIDGNIHTPLSVIDSKRISRKTVRI